MGTLIHNAIHVLLALGLAPLLLGVIAKTKALFAGRVGPPVLQPYYDLMRLFRKGSVISTTTTWVFLAGPVVSLVTAGIAVLLIPLTASTAPISFTGDLILFAYLLGIGSILHGTGSPGHGLGVRGHGRRPRGHLRLPGGTGVLPGTARAWPNFPGHFNWPACWAVRSRPTGRLPGLRFAWSCSVGSSFCSSRTRGFPSMIPTRIWSSP